MSMQNNKSPGNDGLTKEFFVTFWEDIKDVFLNSCRTAKLKKELSTSQRQAVIKLIEEKDNKRFIKNWRPISLLNVDHKIISKALALRVKEILPNLISPQQTAYLDSLDHTFVISVWKRFGFVNNFVSWIEALISKQESCSISGCNTTQ